LSTSALHWPGGDGDPAAGREPEHAADRSAGRSLRGDPGRGGPGKPDSELARDAERQPDRPAVQRSAPEADPSGSGQRPGGLIPGRPSGSDGRLRLVPPPTAEPADDLATAGRPVVDRSWTDSELAASRRRARPRLVSPAAVARSVAMALLEIEAGCRSAGQLERICSPELWAALEPRIPRRGGPLPTGRSVRTILCQEDTPGLADVVAVLQRGDRAMPVAMRLDASGGRWAVTDLAYWCRGLEA
jgi:Family of unknown function (DUF6459)